MNQNDFHTAYAEELACGTSAKSSNDYYDEAEITLAVKYRIVWKSGNSLSHLDAIKAALRVPLEISGCSVNGCYSAKRLDAELLPRWPLDEL